MIIDYDPWIGNPKRTARAELRTVLERMRAEVNGLYEKAAQADLDMDKEIEALRLSVRFALDRTFLR